VYKYGVLIPRSPTLKKYVATNFAVADVGIRLPNPFIELCILHLGVHPDTLKIGEALEGGRYTSSR
jgi:hypothetical protein